MVTEAVRPPVGIVAHPPEVREQAYQLYKKTADYSLVSHTVNVPIATLRSWSSRQDWDGRIELERVAPGQLDAETATAVVRAVTAASNHGSTEPSDLDLAEKQERYQALTGDAAIKLAEYWATLEGKELAQHSDKLVKGDTFGRKALRLTEERPNVILQLTMLRAPAEKQASAIEIAPD